MRALFLALAMISTPAIAADQFDLVCTSGNSVTRYRVDLSSGEACSDQCDRIWKMGQASSGEIKLIDRAPILRGDLEERSVVNRLNGNWTYFMSLSGRWVSREGKCDRQPFSGFPAAKF